LASSVRSALASLTPKHAAEAPVVAKQPVAPVREPEPEPEPEPEAFAEAEPQAPVSDGASALSEPTQDDEAALAPDADESGQGETLAANGLRVELSAGLGGAMRQSALPTRLGVHELSTGLHPGVSLGLAATGALGTHFMLRASVDYRSSLGLHGVETQGVASLDTPLRSHGVGFGLAPGYRFGDANSVSLHVHVGWYFRGLRPVAQLALPNFSWHGAVLRPELYVPFGDGVVTLRLAPELLFIAGSETSLEDATGIARTGMGFGAEVSLDVRVAEPVRVRIEFREAHVSMSTAWAQSVSDVERFGAVRLVLAY
jgi:hypothetical protein